MVAEIKREAFDRGVDFAKMVWVPDSKSAAASSWRYYLNEKPGGAEDEPARYEALLDRVQKLLASGQIERKEADVIVGRADADGPMLARLIGAFVEVGEEVGAYAADCIVGVADIVSLDDSEAIVEVIEKNVAAGSW